ncbi:hypothetical protein EJB05_28861 [Eragrostis curvula]|uniref:F-box domain-containing protein n=1 Tax=Eragrostis curvula TaxID=38414 RepID=A0A5J9UR92_9POAL|nr:hypothetical protein EJB05_28861 [Eragrostis curvula]
MPKRKRTSSVARKRNAALRKWTSAAPDRDLISSLPDFLLHNILGLLQTREAVQTCVLARRWRHLWKSMPVLRVSGDGSIQSHRKFVDHLLLLRDRSNLEACMFQFDQHDWSDRDYVNLWMRHALLCHVQVLSVTVLGGGGMIKELRLDHWQLVSQYLTTLKLSGLCLHNKFLDFSSCEALKDLEMDECRIYADKISSPTLRHLIIWDCMFVSDRRAHISAPSLISLQVNYNWGKTALLEEMPVLVRATVRLNRACLDNYCPKDCNDASCWRCCDSNAGSVLLNGLSAASNLELTAAPEVFILRRELRWCPTFSKLKTLLLNKWCVYPDHGALICILQHTPLLKMLTLRVYYQQWETESTVPSKDICNLVDQSFRSQNLESVKVECYDLDERVQKILKSLVAYGVPLGKICIQQENKSSKSPGLITEQGKRRSTRARKPVDRLDL